MNFSIGDKASINKIFSFDDVSTFSKLTGDINPVHLNADYAKNTIFEKPIVHGFLFASLISALIANDLPGPGSIYLHQELNFKKPLFHGEEVTATVEIIEIKIEKKIFVLSTKCFKGEEVLILDGKAVIKYLGI